MVESEGIGDLSSNREVGNAMRDDGPPHPGSQLSDDECERMLLRVLRRSRDDADEGLPHDPAAGSSGDAPRPMVPPVLTTQSSSSVAGGPASADCNASAATASHGLGVIYPDSSVRGLRPDRAVPPALVPPPGGHPLPAHDADPEDLPGLQELGAPPVDRLPPASPSPEHAHHADGDGRAEVRPPR
eukprot:4797999-Pyramimonas_sp.AAC.1